MDDESSTSTSTSTSASTSPTTSTFPPYSSEVEKWLEYNFPILKNKIEPDIQDSNMEATEESFQMLSLSFCVQSLVMPKIEEHMRRNVAPKFWLYFANINCDERQGFQNFTNAVNELYTDSSKLLTMLKKLELAGLCKHEYCIYSRMNVLDYFKLVIRGTLLSQLPLHHTVIIEHFYKISFNVFCNIEATTSLDDSNSSSSMLCEGCEQEQTACQCQAIVDVFHETNKKLIELDLLERLVGGALTSLIHLRIESHVARVCNRSYSSSQLEPLENWLETVVMNWLIRIYSGGSSRSINLDPKIRSAVNTFKSKLSYFLSETYTRLRIDQLFNIVIEYPDSRAAVDDLRICLERTDLRKYLIRTLQKALKTRLLHPGVSTSDILTAYIAAIKALRQLDPTGSLLETITEPIKVYLRSREDTVRSVVTGLLDEPSGTSDLADELAKGGDTLVLDGDGSASPLEDKEDWENWQPDPIDAEPSDSPSSAPAKSSSHVRRRIWDIISTLVNVYGSQDLFVNEYRTLLADRLLSQLNYQTETEIRNLELLKIRFGEQQLHHCEVMIKDIYDSKRIDGNIQVDKSYDAERANFATSALILSAQFWPPFKEEWKLELPDFVQEQLNKYVKAFETLKGNRTLVWKSHLGNVNLDVETRDRKLNFNVSPIHATIILHFQEKSEWSLDELSEVMHVPTTVLRRKIAYWVSQSLISETSNNTFILQEELDPSGSKHNQSDVVTEMIDDEEVESAMASTSDQREEVFWSYIVGMLTNLDSMPLDRIHQMLKIFASQGSGAVKCGLPELRMFLDKKVSEHQLLFCGGMYKLPKP